MSRDVYNFFSWLKTLPHKLFGGVDKRRNLRGFSQRSVFRKPARLMAALFIGRWQGLYVVWHYEFVVFSFPFDIATKHSRYQATTSSTWEGS